MKALRRILGDHVDAPAFARAADLLLEAATSAPFEGRPMYAALRAIPIPDEVVARLFHAASLLREHRGDGHIAALMIEGVGGLEAHVLFALDMGMPAEKFGRIHHLPAAQLAAVIDGMRDRGLIGDDGWLSEQGRAVKQRVEALTDDLAAKPYERLEPDELDELMAALEPLADATARRPGLVGARSRCSVRDRDLDPPSAGVPGFPPGRSWRATTDGEGRRWSCNEFYGGAGAAFSRNSRVPPAGDAGIGHWGWWAAATTRRPCSQPDC